MPTSTETLRGSALRRAAARISSSVVCQLPPRITLEPLGVLLLEFGLLAAALLYQAGSYQSFTHSATLPARSSIPMVLSPVG